MHKIYSLILKTGVLLLCISVVETGIAAEGSDNFNTGKLKKKLWDPVQMDKDRMGFEPGSQFPGDSLEGKFSIVLRADESLRNTDNGGTKETTNDFGPSLLDEDYVASSTYMTDVKSIVQRNEIRFRSKYRHLITEPHLYGFSFKVTGDIPETGSMRWVIGQWKHVDVDWPDQSPFLYRKYHRKHHRFTFR